MSIKLVFAVMSTDAKYGHGEGKYHFGKEGGLPWGHYPEDLKHFKYETRDSVLVMGANTFKSLPGKLVGRPHVVLSHQPELIRTKRGECADMIINGGNLSACLEAISTTYPGKSISIIGGKYIIEECIKYALADEIVISFIVPHNGVTFTSDVQLDSEFLEFSGRPYVPADNSFIGCGVRADLCGAFIERYIKDKEL